MWFLVVYRALVLSVQSLCTSSTKHLYWSYKAFVLVVQNSCTDYKRLIKGVEKLAFLVSKRSLLLSYGSFSISRNQVSLAISPRGLCLRVRRGHKLRTRQ